MSRLSVNIGIVDLSALPFDAAHGHQEGEGEYRRVLDRLYGTEWSFGHGNVRWPPRLLVVLRLRVPS